MRKEIISELTKLCSETPPNYGKIKEFIMASNASPEEITVAGCETVAACALEYGSFYYDNNEDLSGLDDKAREKMHSPYLFDTISLLLKSGLDPNLIIPDDAGFSESNILSALEYVDYPYVAADVGRLLLEYGADPNLAVEGETIFSRIDFDTIFDVYGQELRERFDSLVHYWLVLMGFGGTLSNTAPVTFKRGFSAGIFKEHEKFDICIEQTPKVEEGWIMHIFDKRSKWEVAYL